MQLTTKQPKVSDLSPYIKSLTEKEVRTNESRQQELSVKLIECMKSLKKHSSYYQTIFENLDTNMPIQLQDMSKLPLTRKSDLAEIQSSNPPFGGMISQLSTLSHIFQSPGNIYEGSEGRQDYWRMGQAFNAAGFTSGDIVLNCLSYHLTPGGFIMDSGARACGCTVIPAGPGNTEQQLSIIQHLKPTGYAGTPSFLNILLDKAKSNDMSFSIEKAVVSGEALSDELRNKFEINGIKINQAYATADVGLIAYEANKNEGWVVAEDIIVEIVKTGTGAPVAIDEIGELVVSTLTSNLALFRFATGDLTSFYNGNYSCNRTNIRITGWMGRADQTTKIKGMFVHPEQILQLINKHTAVSKVRLVVSKKNHNDVVSLQCEVLPEYSSYETIANSFKSLTKLNGIVELLPIGSLANDGVVIEDQRCV